MTYLGIRGPDDRYYYWLVVDSEPTDAAGGYFSLRAYRTRQPVVALGTNSATAWYDMPCEAHGHRVWYRKQSHGTVSVDYYDLFQNDNCIKELDKQLLN